MRKLAFFEPLVPAEPWASLPVLWHSLPGSPQPSLMPYVWLQPSCLVHGHFTPSWLPKTQARFPSLVLFQDLSLKHQMQTTCSYLFRFSLCIQFWFLFLVYAKFPSHMHSYTVHKAPFPVFFCVLVPICLLFPFSGFLPIHSYFTRFISTEPSWAIWYFLSLDSEASFLLLNTWCL